ncbi:hypothetical protein CDAR_194031 [Caerostris darwini]|uniref:Uncharacterized protein n=1 Tax=Caerostris darwini TaxID=1538125 RepID=A0AAV4USQ8_9ARAC|nr:hypothetical protein CDAR_194031 [Caerostris darwini]
MRSVERCDQFPELRPKVSGRVFKLAWDLKAPQEFVLTRIADMSASRNPFCNFFRLFVLRFLCAVIDVSLTVKVEKREDPTDNDLLHGEDLQ